jgi:hypothetical protein
MKSKSHFNMPAAMNDVQGITETGMNHVQKTQKRAAEHAIRARDNIGNHNHISFDFCEDKTTQTPAAISRSDLCASVSCNSNQQCSIAAANILVASAQMHRLRAGT